MLTIEKFNQEFTKNISETMDNQAYQPELFAGVRKVFDVANTDEYTETFHSTEGFSGVEYFEENEDLNKGNLDKGYKVAFEAREFGVSIEVSKKARLQAKDNTLRVAEIVAKQKKGALYSLNDFVSVHTFRMLNEAFGSLDIKAPDGENLISANHVFKSSTEGFDNLLPAAAISATIVDDVLERAANIVDSTGKAMPVQLDRIFVRKGSPASVAARKLFGMYGEQYKPVSIGDINIYMGEFMIIETPYITSRTAYYFMGDMMNGEENPLFMHFVEAPQIQGAARVRDNLAWAWDYSGSFKFGCRNLPFNLFGSQGA